MPGPAPQSPILVRPLSVAELAAVLTDTLARLSPTRLSIVSDQLRAILHSDRPSDLLAMAALPSEEALDAGIIAIATLPENGDTGTILHVDWARPGNHPDPKTRGPQQNNDRADFARQACRPLRDRMTEWMFGRGVRFVQWATDPIKTHPDGSPLPIELPAETTHPGPAEWGVLMQFENIGTLDYLAVDTFETALPCPTKPAIVLSPLEQRSPTETKDFESLVSQTYQGSLDCPNLESYRRTDQILESYRCVGSYAPDLWFSVHLADQNDHPKAADAIGCCLLARHTNSESQELVLELVYMGIIPSHRGKGLGKQVMQLISRIGEQHNATRLVLAVDQNNHPALAAYQRFGMKPLFSETVWIRSLPDDRNPTNQLQH